LQLSRRSRLVKKKKRGKAESVEEKTGGKVPGLIRWELQIDTEIVTGASKNSWVRGDEGKGEPDATYFEQILSESNFQTESQMVRRPQGLYTGVERGREGKRGWG